MYLFYVDESGQREYNPKNSQHFVLGAAAIAEADWREWNGKINALKMEYFGTLRVEFKSVNLRQPDKRQRFYLKPFEMADARLTEAVEALYALISEAPLTLIAAVVDKRHMVAQYAHPASATEMAYELMLERVAGFLTRCEGTPCGIIIHDLIQETINSQSRSHQQSIISLHERLQHRGQTTFVNLEKIIEGVHFLPTDQSNFLQVADLVSYNVFRQFTHNWQEWENGATLSEITKYPFFERLLPKFYKSEAGAIKGYGIKKFPTEKRIR